MTQENIIKALKREILGSTESVKLRNNALVPAVIYGRGKGSENISVAHKFFQKAYDERKFLSRIFEIEINGAINKLVVKDYQLNHITLQLIHIDFMRLADDLTIKLKLPIFYINKGKSEAIKLGAMLNVVKYYVHVRCLGTEIPERLEIDLADSKIGTIYYVEDLDLPKSAIILRPKELIANFVGKRGLKLEESK